MYTLFPPPPSFSLADAMLQPTCDHAAKRSQLEVPMDAFRLIFGMALDDIGCMNGMCRMGESEFKNYSASPQELEYHYKRD